MLLNKACSCLRLYGIWLKLFKHNWDNVLTLSFLGLCFYDLFDDILYTQSFLEFFLLRTFWMMFLVVFLYVLDFNNLNQSGFDLVELKTLQFPSETSYSTMRSLGQTHEDTLFYPDRPMPVVLVMSPSRAGSSWTIFSSAWLVTFSIQLRNFPIKARKLA